MADEQTQPKREYRAAGNRDVRPMREALVRMGKEAATSTPPDPVDAAVYRAAIVVVDVLISQEENR